MKKRTARISLSLPATLATSIVLLCAACTSASAATFHSESSPTFHFGGAHTENVLTVNGGTVKCKQTGFESGEIIGTSVASVLIHPIYSECTAFGQAATVTVNGCQFEFTASSATAGSTKIICSSGKEIIAMTSSGCTIKVKGQTPTTSSVDYKNEGSGSSRVFTTTFTIEGITYTSSGGVCGTSGTNGKYTGSVRTAGFKTADHGSGGQQGIWVE